MWYHGNIFLNLLQISGKYVSLVQVMVNHEHITVWTLPQLLAAYKWFEQYIAVNLKFIYTAYILNKCQTGSKFIVSIICACLLSNNMLFM